MRDIRRPTFRTKLVVMICLFTVLLVLSVSILNYRWYSRQLTRQTVDQTQQIIEQAGSNIETYLKELDRLTLAPYYNDSVLEKLEMNVSGKSDQLEVGREIETFLSSVMTLPRDEILRVYLMNSRDIYAYTRTPYEMSDYENYLESSWYRAALSTTKPIYIPPHSEKAFGEKRTSVFSVVRQIRSKKNNNQVLGVVKVDADYTGIKKICDRVKLKNNGALLIFNEDNQIIYQTAHIRDDTVIQAVSYGETEDENILTDKNGNEYLVNSLAMPSSELKIIALNSYQELMQPTKDNLKKTIYLALSCILLTILFFILFIKRFLNPLFEIIGVMKKVEDGDLSVQVAVRSQDEIGYLASAFNKMVRNLQRFLEKNTQLVKEVYEAKYLYKVSQYDALCGQIKPHFMYNTLNTISLLIKCSQNKKAVTAIESFSRYLGGIMNVDKEITIEEELQICKAYLSIMQIRYEDKLTYDIVVDEKLNSYRIPSLSIQPLIENAVKYGCEPKRGETHIKVASTITETGCTIIVSDDGLGMDPEQLEQVERRIKGMKTQEEVAKGEELGNIGLSNICKRLILKFGGKADVRISSIRGNGTTVILSLPGE